ncbi:MAG TPA: hypothetical protein PKD63_07880 [Solirubrobacteraceae bacterium]|nr:hypothetical protein [Solirubrobacteraceae bacterium]
MVRRLRRADWCLLVSAVIVPVTLALDWFRPARTGWSALGWALLALIVATAALALVVVVLIASGARDGVNVPPAVVLMALAPVALLATLVVTLLKPGDATGIAPGAWAGILALGALKASAWFSMRDERLDQPARQVEPPPARPAPPAAERPI